MTTALLIATFVCLVYLIIVYTLVLVLVLVAFGENQRRVQESRAEDFETIAASRFTIPVSVVAPMRDEEVLALPVCALCSSSTTRSTR